MTQAEFDLWWSDAVLRFPSVDSWLVKVTSQGAADSVTSQRMMLRTWFDVLRETSLTDALEVNRKMQAGELEWVGEYDNAKEKLPQHVRRLARQVAWEQREHSKPETFAERRPTDFPAGKILRRIIEATERGISPDDARAEVLKEIPVGRPNWEPRYRCPVCLDAGFVTVASASAIEAMVVDRFYECHHREGVMRCSCKGHLPHNPRRPIAVYDDREDFKVVDFLWRQPEIDRLREWVENKRHEYWESRRHPEFDRFNQREFTS